MKKTPLKILIIGGVAGGATAAARARRNDEKAEITIIERGPYISFANCGLPYYISGDITKREHLLLQTPEGFFSRYNVVVKTGVTATSINREQCTVTTKDMNGSIEDIKYDRLILSQGASPVIPPIEGANSKHCFVLRDIDDMDKIDLFIKQHAPKKAIVAGGGFIGIEMAEALHKRNLDVTIVEKAPQLMLSMDSDMAHLIEKELQNEGVNLKIGTGLTSVDENSKTVSLENGETLLADIVLFAVGVRPEINLAKSAGLKIGSTGAISVNTMLQSSDPKIYAVGDMVEVHNRINGKIMRLPLAGPANRQGRIAGANATGDRLVYSGVIGTSIAKIFDKTAGSTGINETNAKLAGLDVGVALIHKHNHAGYYPNAKYLTLKLIYEKGSGKLLGALAFGEEGVDKRIDVLATALMGGLTINDLAELDLSYAPPYSSANDPINIAAFVAQNQQNGFSPSILAEQFIELYKTKTDLTVIDVRERHEYGTNTLDKALLIPLSELRSNIDKIPRTGTVFTYCGVGYRGHLATRILIQNGFENVYNILGGFKSLQ